MYKDDNDWNEMYEHLIEYYKKFGSSNVPNKWEANPKLPKFVNKQRNLGNEKMKEDRIKLLDDLNFDWSKPKAKGDEIWNLMYEELVAYKAKHGDCAVPHPLDGDPSQIRLAKWYVR